MSDTTFKRLTPKIPGLKMPTRKTKGGSNDERSYARVPAARTRKHRIALIDGPNMSNLGHRSKKVYGPNQLSIDGLHEYVRFFAKSLGVHPHPAHERQRHVLPGGFP
jgi:hypothetical protein